MIETGTVPVPTGPLAVLFLNSSLGQQTVKGKTAMKRKWFHVQAVSKLWEKQNAGPILHGSNNGNYLHIHKPSPWCPLNATVEICNFLIWCPLPWRKCVGALALSKTNHKGLKMIILPLSSSGGGRGISRRSPGNGGGG